MKEALRRFSPLDRLFVAYAVAYFLWLCVRVPGSPSTSVIGEFAFYPLGLVVAWANWKNSLFPDLDRRTRLAWRFLALAALCLWISGSAWSFYLRHVNPSGWPWWIDRLEFIQHGLAIVGFLAFPGQRTDASSRRRFLVDIALILVAGVVLASHFGLRAMLWDESTTIGLAVLESGADWALFVLAAVGYLSKRDRATRTALGCLLIANSLYLLGNYVLAKSPGTYRIGNAVDGFWFAAWVFRGLAARTAAYHYLRLPAAPREAENAHAYHGNPLAYLMAGGAFLLLITQASGGDRDYVLFLAMAAALMASLLILRQYLEMTENRRLFRERAAQEGRFRSLVQNSSDVILIVDPAGIITFVSPSADRVFGTAHPLRPGSPIRAVFGEAGHEAVAQTLAAGGERTASLDLQLEAAPGQLREVEAVVTDLRGDPDVGGLVLNCRDITDRNELERQLQHTQKLEVVGHMAGGLAHDFNNVLAVIRGYAELLRLDVAKDERIRGYLARIDQAVERAAAVTGKLLALSRKQAVRRVPLDLGAVLRGLQPILVQLLTDRVEVSVEIAPDLWRVKADQGQMEQVLINLAANARDAMPDGGVLQISLANHSAAAGTPAADTPPGNHVLLRVRDTGTGMTDAVRQRIFEPFFTTKPQDRGMGLGLAMVQGIIADSGGSIEVDSRPGKGTCFTVWLPRTEQAVALAQEVPAPATRTPGRRSVLLVDDDPDVRAIARRQLERGGFTVEEAADGFAALKLASTPAVPVDVLVTDLVMPGMSGQELIPRFLQLRKGTPVVCITGFAGDQSEGKELGPDIAALVPKPFSGDTLVRAVDQALAASPR